MVMGAEANAVVWKEDFFPEYLIPDILELIINTWVIFPKPKPLDPEVPISEAFTKKLRAEKNQRDDLPFKIRPELVTLNTGDDTDGRIDICFDFIGTPYEEIYFAFECKRLRIPYPDRLDTNNSDYVNEQGMMCFITGKYSRSVTNGGMIAYVMDGNTNKAIDSVGKLIKRKSLVLKLTKDTGLESSSMLISYPNVRETTHTLSKRNFTIHHIFLAV